MSIIFTMILECFLVWKCTLSHGCNFKKYNIYEYSLLDLQNYNNKVASWIVTENTKGQGLWKKICVYMYIKKSLSSFKNHILQINTEFKT